MAMIKKEGTFGENGYNLTTLLTNLTFFFKTQFHIKKDVLHYKDGGDGRDTALFTYIIPLINEQMGQK